MTHAFPEHYWTVPYGVTHGSIIVAAHEHWHHLAKGRERLSTNEYTVCALLTVLQETTIVGAVLVRDHDADYLYLRCKQDAKWVDPHHRVRNLYPDSRILEVFIRDGGQSCCEARWMTCEDNLMDIQGALLKDIRLSAAGPEWELVERARKRITGDTSDDHHDIQFVDILTSKGPVQLVTHNNHNGYYGGFSIQVAVREET